jgi:hypothetical protein
MENYVLKNNKTGKYIGIDNASCGYPYECELTDAKIWTDKKQAKNYADTFPNKEVTLHRIKVKDEPVNFNELYDRSGLL